LPLAPVPDLIANLAQQKRTDQLLVGFAAQTGDIIPPAIAKLKRKKLSAIVANPVDQADAGFGSDNNQAVIIFENGQQKTIPPCSKLEMAHHLLRHLKSQAE
jgi:phosphopantothenoylcysteine decarboxylase/phosphopantothenate--cysteine ligase